MNTEQANKKSNRRFQGLAYWRKLEEALKVLCCPLLSVMT